MISVRECAKKPFSRAPPPLHAAPARFFSFFFFPEKFRKIGFCTGCRVFQQGAKRFRKNTVIPDGWWHINSCINHVVAKRKKKPEKKKPGKRRRPRRRRRNRRSRSAPTTSANKRTPKNNKKTRNVLRPVQIHQRHTRFHLRPETYTKVQYHAEKIKNKNPPPLHADFFGREKKSYFARALRVILD